MPVIVWILLIVGILCTLFPSRITAGFGGNRALRRVLLVFGGGVLLICLFTLILDIL